MRRRAAFLLLAVLPLSGALAACNATPDASIARLSFGIVVDRGVHRYATAFRVWVGRADLNGSRVTCDQIPNTYTFESFLSNGQGQSNLACVNNSDCAVQLAWDGSDPSKEASQQLRVLTGMPVIVVAEALAQGTSGTFFIGRGCRSITTGFVEGPNAPVEIDVTASVGAKCSGSGCEQNLTCQQGPGFTSGYCTRTCSSNADCPPASHCVSGGTTGSFCARLCEDLRDCNAVDGHDCQGASGTDGCANVCVPQSTPKC
ncbi:MAG: hypothetical protein KC503_14845 [Myxococcales bacterium]|nr:hypothetical protein [Myxococcales bacterium]